MHSCSGTYWSGHIWSRGHAGCTRQWLCVCSISIPGATTSGAWSVVLFKNVKISGIFLLQKFCIHFGSLLVCVVQWIFSWGMSFVLMTTLLFQFFFQLLSTVYLLDCVWSTVYICIQCSLHICTYYYARRFWEGSIFFIIKFLNEREIVITKSM